MTATRKPKILVLDDDPGMRFAMQRFLEGNGYSVIVTDHCQAAQNAFVSQLPDAAILDYSLPDGNALQLLQQLRSTNCMVPIIILTGHGTISLAVEAIKQGAEQFLTKPIELPVLLVLLERMLENQRNRQKQLARESRGTCKILDPFLGDSPLIRNLREQSLRLASAQSPVLICGETGSGKGVLARWLHQNGPRAKEPLVDLNCSGLSRELLESELFGYEKGAFTGATGSKPGLLELAHRGTVFLDELADMSLEVQPRLLKVLEDKELRRLGDVRVRKIDVRLITATHQNLPQLVQENRFRSDLYFRINIVTLTVPPLRERVEDIPAIAAHLLLCLAKEMGRDDVRLSPDATQALACYGWPGNVRELRNVLERALLLTGRSVIGREDLCFDFFGRLPSREALTLLEVEREHILKVLERTHGHIPRAARILGVGKNTLYSKIRRYQIPSSISGRLVRKQISSPCPEALAAATNLK